MTLHPFLRNLFGALTIFTSSCGANVVIDPIGGGGAGGSGLGGSSSPSSVSGSSSGSTTTGPSASSSSGGLSPCDGTSNCAGCVDCSVNDVCTEEWIQCKAAPNCIDLMYCLADCQGDMVCIDKCTKAFPAGVEQYNITAVCVICNACKSDCSGTGQGCM